MWPRFATSSSLRCSFCHKPKDQVEQLLAGARGVSICNTCVDCCQQVMRDASERSSQFPLAPKRCVIVFPLPQSQTKPASKGLRDAAQLDRHRSRSFGARGASPAALPTKAESAPAAHGKGAQA
jgi:ClpX C4-type zinc finger